jgi:hypothetical protein
MSVGQWLHTIWPLAYLGGFTVLAVVSSLVGGWLERRDRDQERNRDEKLYGPG